jgi:uncharacterized BrkB/YihY/UPF0761 family membrane protein
MLHMDHIEPVDEQDAPRAVKPPSLLWGIIATVVIFIAVVTLLTWMIARSGEGNYMGKIMGEQTP